MTSSDLEHHIKLFIPKGWVGPIREFDFAPLISEEEFKIIINGKIPESKQYDKWYVKDAIIDWWKKNGINKGNNENKVD